jgi:hypothetical protein
VTTRSPDDQAVPSPPEDTTQAYARRVWRDVRALLIVSSVAGVAVIAVVLLLGYRMAGVAGLVVGVVMAVVGIVLVARKLLTY